MDEKPANMANLESRKHISPDLGFPVTLHPNFSPKIKDWVPPEPARQEFDPGKDRALYADPTKKALLSAAHRVDLTESIGTILEGVQLSQLSAQQLDELALLVNERSVVFFREQDLTTEGQVKLFEHYGTLYTRTPACSTTPSSISGGLALTGPLWTRATQPSVHTRSPPSRHSTSTRDL